jgi:hypothetical protein
MNPQTVHDVAMIARNAIDKVIELTRWEWIGLTEDEIHQCFCHVEYETPNDWNADPERWCQQFARYLEQRLKEKNHD